MGQTQITPVPSPGATPVPSTGATGQAGQGAHGARRRRVERLFFLKKFLEDFIDVFSMTNVMDLDDMVLVVNFINNPKPSHF